MKCKECPAYQMTCFEPQPAEDCADLPALEEIPKDWRPLARAIGTDHRTLARFMHMGQGYAATVNTQLWLYKGVKSRHYLNLDEYGRPYYYEGRDEFGPHPYTPYTTKDAGAVIRLRLEEEA